LLRSRLASPSEGHAALEAYSDALPAEHRWQRARVAERMAELEIAVGDTDAAQAHLLLALACALEQGIEPLERRARAALKSIGREPIPSAMERRKRSLTAAELRVALRAVTGLSNREVARELFVTPKTVEFHLARIFRKLGVGSRQELATAFAEND
jgi:DNA-binding CsgD family transcriptional regulator